MDESTISAVVAEVGPLLVGRAPGKIYQLDQQSLAIDFGLRRERYLFIAATPAQPRFYLIKRRVRDLEKQSLPLNQFCLTLRKELSQTRVAAVEKIFGDRIVALSFAGQDELARPKERTLVVQLTGRSANLFLLAENNVIVSRARSGNASSQMIGERYEPPKAQPGPGTKRSEPNSSAKDVSDSQSLSESLDAHYTALAARQAAQSQLRAVRGGLEKEISRRRKLLKQLERDLAQHANAEEHKRIGDLLLANASTAARSGGRVAIVDYFCEGTPKIEIEIEDKLSVPEEASRRFEMYSRSKRARKLIASRIEKVRLEIKELEQRRDKLGSSEAPVAGLQRGSLPQSQKPKADGTKRIPGTRRYISSEGYEILVGRAARDNDNLTFKIAKPNDLWLHAADYSGSHVIIRKPSRKEIPHRTLIEAAQLAAFFSQAKDDPKVDVHYTERKFVSKPKGAAAGLVRMSRFKNIIVKPGESTERVK